MFDRGDNSDGLEPAGRRLDWRRGGGAVAIPTGISAGGISALGGRRREGARDEPHYRGAFVAAATSEPDNSNCRLDESRTHPGGRKGAGPGSESRGMVSVAGCRAGRTVAVKKKIPNPKRSEEHTSE